MAPQGIGEIDLKTSVYPNPVDDLMTIRSDEDIQLVSVYNILGVKVKEVAVNQKETVIDLTELSAGAYLVKIVAGEKKSMKTIIKK